MVTDNYVQGSMTARLLKTTLTRLTVFVQLLIGAQAYATIRTYPAYGGTTYESPDYKITVQQGSGPEIYSFACYSYMKDEYEVYNRDGTLREIKRVKSRDNATSHTSTIFSFDGSPVTVRIIVQQGAAHISLPLTSARVLPSSYNIPCTIENGNTIVFTMDRPEKVVVIPNYDIVWEEYETLGQGHKPISAWREYGTQKLRSNYHDVNDTEISEGFKNPVIIIAHELEQQRDIPDKAGPNTLVVNPGDNVTQGMIYSHDVIWFTPGMHDLSHLGDDPGHQVFLKKGQTVYIEGGACVIARFKRDNNKGSGATSIKGRGVLSGMNLKWVKDPDGMGPAIVDVDTIKGITITDRAAYGILQNAGKVSDIAMIGAWHGNTDSIEGDNSIIEDSLLMSGDDNLKMLDRFHARRCVILQGQNAHPIMVQENLRRDFSSSTAEDIDIVVYSKTPPRGNGGDGWETLSASAIACVRGGDNYIRNFTFRDIRIESPYLIRVIDVYNLNTNEINPGWFRPTSPENHTRVDGMLFENITVNSPIICLESLLGSAYDSSMNNLTFKNLEINGIMVTEQNKDNYFEFEGDLQGVMFEIMDDKPAVPNVIRLLQNYPNPFNPTTTISYSIPTSDFVTLKIYDLLGREVQTLVSKFQKAGTYSLNFDASGLFSGIYFYKLQVDDHFVETKKMLHLH